MNERNEDHLDELCGAVADGTPVDWQSERARTEPAEVVEELRVVEQIAAAYRVQEVGPNPAAGGEIGPLPPEILAAFPSGAWGPLQIRGVLGQGSYADVYVAFDTGLKREVALKVLRRDRRLPLFAEDRFLDEAQRLARVRHPNVVIVHGVGRFEGRIGIWSDRIAGQTLEQMLGERGPLSANEAAGIGVDLCRALAALHAAGIVHGDVTTNNVMRENGGRIVLMDFGASSEAQGPEPLAAFGTLAAMPPERLRGDRGDTRSDLYSLGVLLYRLLTGRYPHTTTPAADLLSKVERGPEVLLRDARPELPTGLVRVIEQAMDPDPDRRNSSAGALERALVQAISPPSSRPNALLLALTAIVLIALAVVGVRMNPWHPTTLSDGGMSVSPSQPVAPGTARDAEDASRRIEDSERVPAGSPTAPIVATATLHRVRAGTATLLGQSDPVAPGDGLYLELQCPERIHAYILSEDQQGQVFVLYPAPDLTPVNPLPPGVVHRLPGHYRDRAVNWQVTSVGGSETVIVLASRKPLVELEDEIESFPKTQVDAPISYHSVSPEAMASLRGIGGMMEALSTESSPPGRLADVLGKLPAGATGDVWVWQMVLLNREN